MTHFKFGKTLPLATALAVSLWGSASFAEMSNFQQLEQQVINNLATVGISSAKVGMLTMAEIATLSAILDSTDNDTEKAAAATKLIETATTEPTRMKNNEGTMQLEQQLMVQLASAGITLPEGTMLSPSQVARLNIIFTGMDTDEEKKASAEIVIAEAMTKVVPSENSGMDQLEEQLIGKLASVGLEKPPFGSLTMAQVASLNAIFDGQDADSDKKTAAMKILNLS